MRGRRRATSPPCAEAVRRSVVEAGEGAEPARRVPRPRLTVRPRAREAAAEAGRAAAREAVEAGAGGTPPPAPARECPKARALPRRRAPGRCPGRAPRPETGRQ